MSRPWRLGLREYEKLTFSMPVPEVPSAVENRLLCLGRRFERCLFSHSCCACRGARCHLGEIVDEGRHVVLFQRWVLLSIFYSILGQEGGRSLGRVSGVLTKMSSCDEAVEEGFSLFQCSLSYC